MDKVGDEFGFNEEKARKLVYYLLEDDIRAFKKLIPEIKGMDSISFENLFNGIPFKEKKKKEEIKEEDEDETYAYKVKTQNKKDFKELLNKFDNFRSVLDEWYLDEKYYKYIKELWKNYISIENLKEKDIKLIEDILKSNKINYINWPEDIKDEFKRIVANSGETRIMTLKNIIQNDLSKYNNVIEKLIQIRNQMKEEKKEENKIYEINAQQIIKGALTSIAVMAIGYAYNQGKKAIDIKQLKAVKKYIRKGRRGLSDSKIDGLVNQLLEKIEGDVGFEAHHLSKNCDSWYQSDDLIFDEDDLEVSTFDGKLDFLEESQRTKSFFKSNVVCGLHAALSFINLVYSIYEISNTYKGFRENKIYNSNLVEIEKNFNEHRKEIGILSDDVKESSKKIKEVLELIWQDYKNLQDLIKKINKSIEFQKSQQTTAIAGAAVSIGLGVVGAIGSVATCNVTSAIYCASTVGNAIAGVTYVTDFIMSKKIVGELKETLTKAENLSKSMQDEIDKLLKKLSLDGGEYAKFDLSESCSSVSTTV